MILICFRIVVLVVTIVGQIMHFFDLGGRSSGPLDNMFLSSVFFSCREYNVYFIIDDYGA